MGYCKKLTGLQMKKKGVFIAVVPLLILVLIAGGWLFVKEVTNQLWTSSIQTISENTHQGVNALNIQLERDLDELGIIWEELVHDNIREAGDIPDDYHVVDPDVKIYIHDWENPGSGARLDEEASRFLRGAALEKGVLDSHISSVTGENVFNIFIRGTLADGTPAYLVKEYRIKEIADQFTLAFYDDTGFSYLVNRDGNIMVRFGHRNSNETEYNLFDMVSGEENEPDMLDVFRKSIHDLKNGWAKLCYNGTGMIFCHESLRADAGWLLVSAVPERVITEQIHSILRKTLVFSGAVIGIIILLVAVFYVIKMHENEKHSKELQDALEAADRANKVKERFLMDMSHDIRTPLNAIIGMTTIAQENIMDQEKVKDCLKKLKMSSIHLLALVGDLLDMSQVDQGKVILKEENVRLPQLLEEIAGLMDIKAQEAGLKMELAPIQVQDGLVMGDLHRIRQILLNVIGNAVKYTPSGGRIFLDLTQLERDERDYGVYRFCCRDTGIGMEEKFLERIFLPFERARNSTVSKIVGTGVGLTITKNLLDLMGSTISVESEPDKGSVFTIEFHLKVQEENGEAEEAGDVTVYEAREEFYDGRRVLLVEDIELNMEIMEELLSMAGVKVEKARNGREAVEMVEKNPVGYYDLIFMDIQMPVMDGYEATRQIRRMDKSKVPIFAVSANALAEDVKNAAEAGMDGHIAKPVDYNEIEKVLKQNIP